MATKERSWSYEFTGASNVHAFTALSLGVAGGVSHGNCVMRLEIDVLGTAFGGSSHEVVWTECLVYVLLVDGEVAETDVELLRSGGFDDGALPETPPTVNVTGSGADIEIEVTEVNAGRRYVVDVHARLLERGALSE